MKFIFKENLSVKQPTFRDVQVNQFFVDISGCLCQKEYNNSYFTITNSEGELSCYISDGIDPDMPISRILPEVLKIEY